MKKIPSLLPKTLIIAALFHRKSSFNMATLETLKFDNLALKKLPVDPEERNYVRTVNAACFSRVVPTPVVNPTVVACSVDAISLLNLPASEQERKDFAEYFSGNKVLPGSEPAAHCYCGHQFGNFAGQLGDGAAIYLGEIINAKNERWEIQLKGAGLTPYSRTADGRKVLRSSIREFLCSEAMHFLGIPTTRAGTCITSDSEVVRDIFYDGHPKKEKCSIVLRIAPSFIRFGSFEIFKTVDRITGRIGPSVGRTEILHALLNYVIENFYPDVYQISEDETTRYANFFKEVILRTARLVAGWQSVGFCHGVLNTDNMSILGLTLDYGPFGFLDMYNPDHICNDSDQEGRYSFSKQPEICLWNLTKFAEAIEKALPLSVSVPLLEMFNEEFNSTYMKKMRNKLGLIKTELAEDRELVDDLFSTMENTGADFTNTFCCFLSIDASDSCKLRRSFERVQDSIIEHCYSLEVMTRAYKPNLNSFDYQMLSILANSSNELIEQLPNQLIMSVKKKLAMVEKSTALEKMSQEVKTENDFKLWKSWLQKYEIRLKKDIEACGDDLVSYSIERMNIMRGNNPRFILRNYIIQTAIEKAEKGDYSHVRQLCEVLQTPYDYRHSIPVKEGDSELVNLSTGESEPSTSKFEKLKIDESETESSIVCEKTPNWAFSLKVT